MVEPKPASGRWPINPRRKGRGGGRAVLPLTGGGKGDTENGSHLRLTWGTVWNLGRPEKGNPAFRISGGKGQHLPKERRCDIQRPSVGKKKKTETKIPILYVKKKSSLVAGNNGYCGRSFLYCKEKSTRSEGKKKTGTWLGPTGKNEGRHFFRGEEGKKSCFVPRKGRSTPP